MPTYQPIQYIPIDGSIVTLNCSNPTNNGNLTAGVATNGVTSVITYTNGNGGIHNGQTVTSTGITGLTASLNPGSFVNGAGSLTYIITGTPSGIGTASFALNIGGQSCTLTRSVVEGTISELTCASATNNGKLTAGIVASGVSSVVPYTGGNSGMHNSQSVTSTGIIGLTATISAGSFANGAGSLTYTITGTPSGIGTASFALSIGGQSCTLTRSVVEGTISALTCTSATNNGSLTEGIAVNGVNSVIPYTGGNSGMYNGQTVNSTGITGLNATLSAGSFVNGAGNLTYTITGTPNSSGTASFALNIGGQTCTLTRTVIPLGAITILTCASATNNGVLTAGLAASGVSSVVPYSGGNGGIHNGQTIASTGITGLIATLSTGSFISGAGSLTYSITGTPSGIGTASFALNIGSKTCTLNRTVIAGTITGLTCASTTNNGNLIAGLAASGVSSVVPYSGGNGGMYNTQTATSTGITGLTATLSAGSFTSGAGSLTYSITGTPSASGTASFALNIGEKTCTITRIVYPPQPAYPSGSVFCNNILTIVINVTNPSTGKVWMDRNLGASRAATSSNDDQACGDLYQWGRRSDGHQCIYDYVTQLPSGVTSSLSSSDQPLHGKFIKTSSTPFDWRSPQNTNLWQGVNGVNNPCPSGYRIPTETELNAERLSWYGQNAIGALNSPLKMIMSGYRQSDGFGAPIMRGSTGYYWSSTINSAYSRGLSFFNNEFNPFQAGSSIEDYARSTGRAVRCIKN